MGPLRLELIWFVVAATIPCVLAVRARRTNAPGAAYLASLLWAQSAWVVGQASELTAASMQAKLWLDGLQYVPMALVGAFTLLFAVRFADIPESPWLRRGLLAYFAPPVVLLATAPLHGWFRQQAHIEHGYPFDTLLYPFTALDYWIAVGYLAVAPLSLVLLLRRILNVHKSFVPGHLAVLLGLLLPTVAGLTLSAMQVRFLGQRDVSFIIFGLGALLITWGVERGGALSLHGVARDLIFDKMPVGAVITDEHRRIVDLNAASYPHLLVHENHAIGKELFGTLHIDPLGYASLVVAAAGVAKVVRTHKETRYLEVVWHPLEQGAGRLYLLRDVTREEEHRQNLLRERESLQRSVQSRTRELLASSEKLRDEEKRRLEVEHRLRQAEKMDALGRLAGGVAHDFNNLLTVILGNADVAHDLEQDPEIRLHLDEIGEAAKSAAQLTSQLLSFSRKDAVPSRSIGTAAALDTVTSMLRRLIRADIQLTLEVAPEVAPIYFDEAQLQQALINLVVNARDAMPQGGSIAISASNVEAIAPGTSAPATSWVRIQVRDSGSGIPQAQLAHIFEPFFTTKALGKGTGLGLAMVYGAVQQHGGFCEVDSEEGVGTTFSLYLQQGAALSSASESDEHSSAQAWRGGGRIWLVDDELAVRKMLARALEKAGYQVTSFESGDALLKVGDTLTTADLLISDVMMPGTSGTALAELLRQRLPALQVILITGYTDNPEATLQLPFVQKLLAKPFTPAELLEAVDTLLGAPSTEGALLAARTSIRGR